MNSMQTQNEKFYACAALPAYWHNRNTQYVSKVLATTLTTYISQTVVNVTVKNRITAERFVSMQHWPNAMFWRQHSCVYNKFDRKYLVHHSMYSRNGFTNILAWDYLHSNRCLLHQCWNKHEQKTAASYYTIKQWYYPWLVAQKRTVCIPFGNTQTHV